MTTEIDAATSDSADTSGGVESRGAGAGGSRTRRRAAAHARRRPPRFPRLGRLGRFVSGLEFTGLVFAAALLMLSMTPSLLPRGPLFQGIVSGASAAVGYCFGVFLAWLARFMLSRATRWPSPRTGFWVIFGLLTTAGVAVMVYWFARRQNELRDLMGVERLEDWAYPLALAITAVTFVVVMALGRLWAAGIRRLAAGITRYAPPRVAGVTAATIVVAFTVFLVNGVLANTSMRVLNSTFASINEETDPDTNPPTSVLRSGGPDSLVSWSSLGRQGRIFVSNGPSVEQLSTFNGVPALEPIRVFAGLNSADSIRATAELAAAELERTGGLDRELVAIGSTTGTGWLNRATVDSLEYMYNGDTATVSMQYSFLPSWISFLVDKERARQAGRALFEAVDIRVRAMPEANRPKIVVFGESLGSFAGESAFGTVQSLAARTDGALFVGPTFNNTMWRDVTDERDPGSPERRPVYEDGSQVRFIADAADLPGPDAAWGPSRVVYLQHASDPITWWSPTMVLNEPDWLDEERGVDVLPSTRWIPFVTFLQVSADMAVSMSVPDGHGHNYLRAIPHAWAQILRPQGWTPEKTAALLPRLTRE